LTEREIYQHSHFPKSTLKHESLVSKRRIDPIEKENQKEDGKNPSSSSDIILGNRKQRRQSKSISENDLKVSQEHASFARDEIEDEKDIENDISSKSSSFIGRRSSSSVGEGIGRSSVKTRNESTRKNKKESSPFAKKSIKRPKPV
jgi:hypothetical protein